MRIPYQLDRGELPIVALAIGSGSALLAVGTAIDLPIAVLLAVPLAVYSFAAWRLSKGFRFRAMSIHPEWDSRRINEALRSAPADATVRIMQTWVPEREQLFPLLERLLTQEQKSFELEVLLIHPGASDPDPLDLVAARVTRRDESRAHARSQIVATTEHLFKMKRRIDEARAGKLLPVQLSVRCHRTLPFGPIYQIGTDRLFVGLYLPTRSSLHAPMFEIRRTDSDYWQTFEQAFTDPWNTADEVAGVEHGDLVFASSD